MLQEVSSKIRDEKANRPLYHHTNSDRALKQYQYVNIGEATNYTPCASWGVSCK